MPVPLIPIIIAGTGTLISVINNMKISKPKIEGKKGSTPEKTTECAENGDVIKVNRGLYDHYGIFVKDNQHVINYIGENGSNNFNGIVRETSLPEFLNGANDFIVCRFPEKIEQLTFLDNKNLLPGHIMCE